MRAFALILGCLFVLAGYSHGKACFFKRTELVEKSQVTTIIELGDPGPPESNAGADPFGRFQPP